MSDTRYIITKPEVLRENIFTKVKEVLQSKFPIECNSVIADIKNIEVSHKTLPHSAQKKLRMLKGNASSGVYADIVLSSKDTNKVLDTLKHHRIMNIPYFTDRYTFLLEGNEYSIVNQLRTKSGVYTRKRGNEELESSFNLSKGANFKILMDPKTGVFKLSILHSTIALVPVLKILGADPGVVEKSFGKDLYATNNSHSVGQYEKAIDTLFSKLVQYKSDLGDNASKQEKISAIKVYFEGTALNPETTKITLGEAHTSVSATTMLRAVEKMLRVYKEEDDVDDRDGLEFQHVFTPDDIIKEVLSKSSSEVSKLKSKLDTLSFSADFKPGTTETTQKLKAVFSPSVFTRPVRSFLTTSSISRLPDQINPLEIMDSASIVTRLGEGAISSEQAVPEDTRAVNYSYMGVIDPVMAPESSKIGIDNRFAMGALKGNSDNELYKEVINIKTGVSERHRLIDLYDKVVGFPDGLSPEAKELSKNKSGLVPAVQSGKMVEVKRSTLDFQIPTPHHLNAAATNNIPFLNANQANRILMGAKHQSQAMPLKYREQRLVEPTISALGDKSISDRAGTFLIPVAPATGTVTDITEDYVHIKDKDGKQHLVDYATYVPLTAKTALHNELSVSVGDKVEKGERLGDNTFTKDGKLAMGVNLNIAYMPYKGYNHEDGIVISESASKKLTSIHSDMIHVDVDKNSIMGKSKFKSVYPTLFSKDQLKDIEEDGLVAKGSKVETGDPLLLMLGDASNNKMNLVLGKLHRSLVRPYSDLSEVYDGEKPATVVDVQKAGKHITILLSIEKPAGIGDKLAGTYGNKGVITRVEPDDQIFQSENGKPLDIVFTSAGVIGRINPAQILETTLGKIAVKTGVPYKIENYSHEDYLKFVRGEMKTHGVKDKETLTDPETGKKIAGIFTGVQHIQKLHKTSDTNFSGRGVLGSYDQDEAPVGSGNSGPKALGGMEVNALLAHNARSFLKDSTMLRGSKNSEFWNNYQYGGIAHFPNEKKTFTKFQAILKQAGINVKKEGNNLVAGPLTDKDVLAMSSGEITNALRVDAKNVSPEKGGLFDIIATGGLDGDRWSHVTLAEPVVNPMFEECAASLLGLSKKDMDSSFVNSGGEHLRKELNKLDIDKELLAEEAKLSDTKLKGLMLDKAIKKVKYLRALQRQGLKAGDAYTIQHVPVTPPKMRPISVGKSGDLMTNDSNEFYKNLILNNEAFKKVMGTTGFIDAKKDNRAALQQSVRELVGISAPTEQQLRNRNAKGAVKFIAGDQPKYGFFQRKVIYSKMNLTGRATIAPDETLELDEVGLPEYMAWEMYTPFILRTLTQQGYTAMDAKTEVANKSEKAKRILEMEMGGRPVIINRAPTLWKHSILAVHPKLRAGKTMQVNSLWESSVNMDYDGDSSLNTIVYRVKISEESPDLSLTDTKDVFILDGKSTPTHLGEHTTPFTNTTIRYAEGLINLQDFPRIEESKREEGNKEMFDVPAGVEVLSVMHGTKEWLPVTEYSIHKGLKIFEVETNSKRTIHCSGDDSLITMDEELNYIKTAPKVGISIPRVVDCMNMKDANDELKELTIGDPTVQGEVTFKLNRDFGWLGGAFVGNGWLNKKGLGMPATRPREVMICKVDAPFREKWMEIISSYTPGQHFILVDSPHTYDGTDAFSQKLTMTNPILRNYFRDYHGHSAVGKSLPSFWTKTAEEYRWGLLAGLIDSDGTVSEVKAKAKKYSQIMVVYTSVSKSLIFEIVALANSLGLTASAFFSKMTGAGNESWGATFTVGSILKMQKNLVLHHGEKKDRLASYIVRDTTLAAVGGMTYTPRISHARIKELNSAIAKKDLYKQGTEGELRIPEGEMRSLKSSLCQLVRRNTVMSQATAKKIISLELPIFSTSKFWKKWKDIVLDETIVWENVTSLKLIPELTEAYDITAPPNFTMVTESGFVIQDTMQVHLPISDEAVEEAKTMYPSKLLFSDKKKNHLLMMPSQEPIIGLYAVTKNLGKPNNSPVKKFISEALAWAAYYRGDLQMDDNVEIG